MFKFLKYAFAFDPLFSRTVDPELYRMLRDDLREASERAEVRRLNVKKQKIASNDDVMEDDQKAA